MTRHQSNQAMRITVSGPSGSGTTSVSERLADRFNWPLICAGEEFREYADMQGMTVDELNAYTERNKEFDRRFDERLRNKASGHRPLIFESRYTGRRLENIDLRVWLDAPREVRAKRVEKRESLSEGEALKRVVRRDESVQKRVAKHYESISFENMERYDIQIRTDTWSLEEVVDIITIAIERYQEGGKVDYCYGDTRLHS